MENQEKHEVNAIDYCVGIEKEKSCTHQRRFVSLLETLVSPTSGSTESCRGVTPRLQGWRGLKKAIAGEERGSSVPQEPQTQLSVVSVKDSPQILDQKRMGFFWLYRPGFSVMKSAR